MVGLRLIANVTKGKDNGRFHNLIITAAGFDNIVSSSGTFNKIVSIYIVVKGEEGVEERLGVNSIRCRALCTM